MSATLAVLVATSVVTILVAALALTASTPVAAGSAAVVAALALLGLASLADPVPPAAMASRALAALVGAVATSTTLETLVGDGTWHVAELITLGGPALLPAGVVAGWLAIEVVRAPHPATASLMLPSAVRLVASAALVAGLSPATTGVALVTLAVVAAAIVALEPALRPPLRSWRWPLLVLAATAATLGLPLVTLTPRFQALLVVAVGLLVALAGIVRQRPLVAHPGAFVAVWGSWELLSLLEVATLDLWLAPLAVWLWVTGFVARRGTGTSSWIADVPPLLLVAVPALVERAAGGGGWHAVLAGALGVVAVLGGANGRLGGPLVVGTGLLVAVVGVEVFAVVVAVPTWIWLAVGGAILLAAAAAMELVDGTPVTATRRLVRLVRERYDR